MGFRLHRSGRVMRQHDVFVKGDGDIDFGTSRFFLALQALRDLSMFGFIFDQANDPTDPVFRELVRRCIKDSPLADEDCDKHLTPARDSQFELYIAAACKHAGLTPVEHSSPDVIFNIGNFTYCIEAKRPKTIGAIDGCLDYACDQIEKRKLPGLIAVDTSIAFGLEATESPVPELDEVWELLRHWRIQLKPTPDRVFAETHAAAMNLVIRSFKKTMDRRMVGKPVLGIVFDNQMPRIMSDGDWGLTGASIKYSTSTGPEFDIVADQFLSGLPNC